MIPGAEASRETLVAALLAAQKEVREKDSYIGFLKRKLSAAEETIEGLRRQLRPPTEGGST